MYQMYLKFKLAVTRYNANFGPISRGWCCDQGRAFSI